MVSVMRYGIFFLIVTIILLVASSNAGAATSTVGIQNNAFAPKEITVATGDTVTWINLDTVAQDVDGGSFKSPELGKGEVFSHTFGEPGTYEYRSDIHEFMKGRVIVR